MHISFDNLKRIDGNTLKIIACITMLIDHIGAGIIYPVVNNDLYPGTVSFDQINAVYTVMRFVGRMAFPIFCFLLVEGFIHTHSRLRYFLSLLIFGLISEPFFDITFYFKNDIFNSNIIQVIKSNQDYYSSHCNVFFTLLLGFLAMWAIDLSFKLTGRLHTPIIFSWILTALSIFLAIFIAEKIKSDYHGYGVALIIIFYMLRFIEPINLIAGFLALGSFGTEAHAFPAFILLFFYSKKQGRKLGNFKYFFYAFYPVHILLIYYVRCFLFG